MLRLFLATLLLSACAPALAVYKCTSDGKLSYSDMPCSDGKSVILSEAAQPAAETETHARVLRDKAEANRLQHERHQRENQEERERQQAVRIAAKNQKKCDSLALRKQWADEDAAHASGKSAEKSRLKARRTAEKYALECKKR